MSKPDSNDAPAMREPTGQEIATAMLAPAPFVNKFVFMMSDAGVRLSFLEIQSDEQGPLVRSSVFITKQMFLEICDVGVMTIEAHEVKQRGPAGGSSH